MIRKNMWNTAAKAGLVLGLISSAYLFITQWTGSADMPGFLSSLLGFVLWGAKFGGCIWVMGFFMKKFVIDNPEAVNKDTFRLGTAMAFLSALVFSAVAFANVAYISADMYAEQIETMMQQMAPMMDSNTMSVMDTYMENLPQITFFSNLIYCFIFGTILSYILSRNIPRKDPFADYKPEEQE